MASEGLFEYSVVGGIHMLRLLQPGGKAVKALLDHAETYVVEKPIDGKNLVLIDFRVSGSPRTVEALPHVIAFFARQPRRTPQGVRVAFIYLRMTYGRVLKSFLSLQRFLPQGMAVKFFADEEYEQALEWLHM
jgi:hypothetical protein